MTTNKAAAAAKTFTGVAAGVLLALGSGAASALETTFTGYTDGCFLPSLTCAPVPDPANNTVTVGGLTYNDATFTGTTIGGFLGIGAAGQEPPGLNTNNLGSFTLSGTPFNYTGEQFSLRVAFTAPAGILPSSTPVFHSTITGQVFSGTNGSLNFNFDNTEQLFTFGSGATAGSFRFSVNDASLLLSTANGAPQTIAITGQIFSQVGVIPEPETYALLMAGLGAVGFMARRRKQRTSD